MQSTRSRSVGSMSELTIKQKNGQQKNGLGEGLIQQRTQSISSGAASLLVSSKSKNKLSRTNSIGASPQASPDKSRETDSLLGIDLTKSHWKDSATEVLTQTVPCLFAVFINLLDGNLNKT